MMSLPEACTGESTQGYGTGDQRAGSPRVSVIIPTHNRKISLKRTLESLVHQTCPLEDLEAIVVDDGSNDGTPGIEEHAYPFGLRYVRQRNQGATVARNHGARHSQGELLVFVDDDIQLHPEALECLLEQLDQPNTIALGTLRTPKTILDASSFARSREANLAAVMDDTTALRVPFQHCMTGLLAIRRADFSSLGMFEDPTGGWPNWDDVDFGYRAHQAGYRLIRPRGAVAEHWDHTLTSLERACERWQKAGHSGVKLLQRYPSLKEHIPMLQDKGPICWNGDSLGLILRKLMRQIISSRPVMWAMERAVHTLDGNASDCKAVRLLHRWIVSGYIDRGYREGLRELAR